MNKWSVLSVLLAAAFQIVLSQQTISYQCEQEIQAGADCIFVPVRQCFARAGCTYPEGRRRRPPHKGRGPPPCIRELKEQLKPHVDRCVQQQLPRGVPEKFRHMLKHHAHKGLDGPPRPFRRRFRSEAEMKQAMKERMRQKIIDTCGESAVQPIESCLDQRQQTFPQCMDLVSDNCKQEVIAAGCDCAQSVLQQRPEILDQAINCAQEIVNEENARFVPPFIRDIINNATPQLVSGMIERGCANGGQMIFSQFGRFRGAGGSPGGRLPQ